MTLPDLTAVAIPDLLTEAEAAKRLHICTRTLRRIRQRGEIRFVSVSERKVLYRPEDITAFVEKRATLKHIAAPRTKVRTNRKRAEAQQGDVISFTARRAQRRGTA